MRRALLAALVGTLSVADAVNAAGMRSAAPASSNRVCEPGEGQTPRDTELSALIGEWRSDNGFLRLWQSGPGEISAYGAATSGLGMSYQMSGRLEREGASLVIPWERQNGYSEGGTWQIELNDDVLLLVGFFGERRQRLNRFTRTGRAPAKPVDCNDAPAPQPQPPRQDPPQPNPPQRPEPQRPAPEDPESDEFQPLGAWSVRIDRVENPPDDRLTHVYLTLRNDSTRNLLQTQGISVLHESSSGYTTESAQGLKALPGRPELFGSPPPVVRPGRELRSKFVFDRDGRSVSVTVLEGEHSATFDF